MTLTLSLVAIVLAIIIGWKFKVNAGIIGMAFAFLICILTVDGGKVGTVIGYWPSNIVFYLLSIALFSTMPPAMARWIFWDSICCTR